jgi:hypothetical protein
MTFIGKQSTKSLPTIDKNLWVKTDNSHLVPKLALRRYFLAKYPLKTYRVIDCCAGEEQAIWTALRKEFPNVQYVGLDKKRVGGGVIKIDAVRWMSQTEWSADVVDIDTYGEPWPIYFSMLENFVGDEITVFLTYCRVPLSTISHMSHAVRDKLGLPEGWKIWNSNVLMKMSIQACVAHCLQCGFEVIEAKKVVMADAPEHSLQFYAGLRLRWLK